jgi:hypothetical protein
VLRAVGRNFDQTCFLSARVCGFRVSLDFEPCWVMHLIAGLIMSCWNGLLSEVYAHVCVTGCCMLCRLV